MARRYRLPRAPPSRRTAAKPESAPLQVRRASGGTPVAHGRHSRRRAPPGDARRRRPGGRTARARCGPRRASSPTRSASASAAASFMPSVIAVACTSKAPRKIPGNASTLLIWLGKSERPVATTRACRCATLGMHLRVRVRQPEDDRLVGHQRDHLLGHRAARDADVDVGAVHDVGQLAGPAEVVGGVLGERQLHRGEVGALGVQHPLAVEDREVLDAGLEQDPARPRPRPPPRPRSPPGWRPGRGR